MDTVVDTFEIGIRKGNMNVGKASALTWWK